MARAQLLPGYRRANLRGPSGADLRRVISPEGKNLSKRQYDRIAREARLGIKTTNEKYRVDRLVRYQQARLTPKAKRTTEQKRLIRSHRKVINYRRAVQTYAQQEGLSRREAMRDPHFQQIRSDFRELRARKERGEISGRAYAEQFMELLDDLGYDVDWDDWESYVDD